MLLNDIAVVIGMPRTGTTWLYENLKTHPDLCASDYKEINRYLLEMSDEKYLDYFRGCSKKIKLDISPLYFFDTKALSAIANKHDKIILLIRQPEEWIESLNSQIKKYSGNVAEMSQSKKYNFPIQNGRTVVFNYGEYQHQQYIAEIKSIFGEKLLVLDFAILQNSPIAVLKTIECYLKISSHFTETNSLLDKINASEQPIHKAYAFLLRSNLLYQLIPIVLYVLPKGLVHWLRKHIVYGKKIGK
jgi:hypothetical protein